MNRNCFCEEIVKRKTYFGHILYIIIYMYIWKIFCRECSCW